MCAHAHMCRNIMVSHAVIVKSLSLSPPWWFGFFCKVLWNAACARGAGRGTCVATTYSIFVQYNLQTLRQHRSVEKLSFYWENMMCRVYRRSATDRSERRPQIKLYVDLFLICFCARAVCARFFMTPCPCGMGQNTSNTLQKKPIHLRFHTAAGCSSPKRPLTTMRNATSSCAHPATPRTARF